MAHYLQLHNGTWRVRMVVPPPLVGKVGKRFLLRGTGTAAFDRAERIAKPTIKEFQRIIDRAIGKPSGRVHLRHVRAEHRSSEWYTPEWIFTALGVTFDMDVASPGAEIVPWVPARRHYTIADDGLAQSWQGLVWCNPPFGLRFGLAQWLRKFIDHGNGIGLLPVATYTKWWQDIAGRVDAVLFIAGYVNFLSPRGKTGRVSFGSCLIGVGAGAVTVLRAASARGLGQIAVPTEDHLQEWGQGLAARRLIPSR